MKKSARSSAFPFSTTDYDCTQNANLAKHEVILNCQLRIRAAPPVGAPLIRSDNSRPTNLPPTSGVPNLIEVQIFHVRLLEYNIK